MRYDPAVQQRRSVRLAGYDYAQAGAYYLTICAYERRCVFGRVVGEEMVLTRWGEVVAEEWVRSGAMRPGVEMDAFVVMPNHLHGIVVFTVGADGCPPERKQGRGAGRGAPMALGRRWPERAGERDGAHSGAPLRRTARSVGSLVAQFKATAARRINVARETPGAPVWQRNYYEHVIRDEGDLEEIRRYIAENPQRWGEDRENPALSAGARRLREG